MPAEPPEPAAPDDAFPTPVADEPPVFTDVPDVRRQTVADEVNATLNLLLPWGISLLLHAGAVLVAVFAVWTVVAATTDEEDVVPVLELSPTPEAPLLQEAQVQIVQAAQTPAPVPTPTPQPDPAETIDLSPQLVGLAGPATTPFGATMAGPQLQSSFMGSRGGNARNIAFLIDCSGSLVDTLPFVLDELKSSIRKLSEQQRFTIVFYGNFEGREFVEVPPGRLRPATAAHKKEVIEWIDIDSKNVFALGSGNPIPALNKVLSYSPQLVYLLSDNILGEGAYQIDQDRLLRAIQQTNNESTKINTIQFLYPDPFMEAGRKGTLELIAEQSGGKYRFVSPRELGLE